MRFRIFLPTVSMLLTLAAGGCAGHQKKPVAAVAIQPRFVGSVAFVNEPLNFVLVDVGSLYSPLPGAALKSFAGEEESAVLTVSPERKRPFITADIIKGMPHRGDLVYQ